MRRRPPPSGLLALALALALTAGCDVRRDAGGSGGGDRAAADSAAADSAAAARTAARAPTEVSVALTEWDVELSRDTVPAGPTAFRFVNRGKEVHSFEVESDEAGVELRGEELSPGQEGRLTTELTPGTWEVYCPLVSPSAAGGHSRRGMRAELIVR